MGGVCWWVESVIWVWFGLWEESVMWVWPGWFFVPKTFMIYFFMAIFHLYDMGRV